MNESTIGTVMTIFVLGLVTGILAATPYLTRKTECFGVSIPESDARHPSLVLWRRRYATEVGLLGLVLLGASLGASLVVDMSLWLVVPMLLLLGLDFWRYLVYHAKVKELKAQEGWSLRVDTRLAVPAGEEGRRTHISPWWIILLFLVPIATAGVTVAAYPGLPDMIPTHFGITGIPDAFSPKSWSTVMLLPITQVFLCLVFLFSLVCISGSRTVVDPQKPQESLQRAIHFRRSWGIFLLISGFATLGMFSVMQLVTLGILPQSFISFWLMLVPLGIVVGAIWLSVRVGQGGSRLPTTSSSSSTISVRDDDRYWKAGCFYVNRDDPAIFVEKRFGIGWTCNFGRPLSYILLGGILLLAFLVPVIISL